MKKYNMITYEKAQELKEAGFPLRRATENDDIRNLFNTEDDSTVFVVSTLSELIEACGGLYFNLERNVDDWQALINNGKELIAIGKGSTPEEAVSNLYLALKKYKQV